MKYPSSTGCGTQIVKRARNVSNPARKPSELARKETSQARKFDLRHVMDEKEKSV